jgi:hypothetical protein
MRLVNQGPNDDRRRYQPPGIIRHQGEAVGGQNERNARRYIVR